MFLREKAGQKGMTFNLSNPSINPSVPEQKSEVQTALEIIAETKDRNGGKTDFSLCTEI